MEPVGRWAVIPGTGGLRLRWAEATLESIQLSEPRCLPAAVDPGLVPGAADPAVLSEEAYETVLESEPSDVESLDLLSGVEPDLSDKELVDLLSGMGLEPSPVASLGLQSSGSYMLCLSCSFLLLISAILSTFCSSLAL